VSDVVAGQIDVFPPLGREVNGDISVTVIKVIKYK
jgi:hypothetical protein